jgi:hypothetical protein
MTKTIQLIFIIIINSLVVFGQKLPVPQNYSVIDTVLGDLNNDGIKELVVAYNTKTDTDEGVPRELIIYKKSSGKWVVWKKSSQALYDSRDGGMMGDPYGNIEVEKGILKISQSGGSSWKWGHIDTYRYQNGEFYLIGYTATAGKICEYWEQVDFNLSTGKLIVKKEYENCDKDQEIYKRENEALYKKGLRITLQGRSDKEVKIVTPKYHHEIYVAIKSE